MENNRHSKFKRIMAWVGIVLLVAMYVLTLIASLIDSPYSHGLFVASIYCSFVIPILIFAVERIVTFISGKTDSKNSD